MKNFTKTMAVLLSFVLLSGVGLAQREVNVTSGQILNDVIYGDTTATGERVDDNTVYILEGNGLYPVTSYIRLDVPLQIKGNVAAGEALPKIFPQPDNDGNYPQVIRSTGDITLENIYMSNKNGDVSKWGGFRAEGYQSTVSLINCHLEYDRACALQLRADSITIIMDSCIVSKMGNQNLFQGNGRLIDTRGFEVEKIKVTNTTVYLCIDRIIRTMGAGDVWDFEFDHNTVVHNQGRHGLFQLGNIHKAKITNNLFVNPMYGGAHPMTEEQTHPDSDNMYLVTADTINSDTEFTISNNVVGWTQDVIDYWASNDSVSKPGNLAPIIADEMGATAAEAAFTEELVTFTSMPAMPISFLEAIYADPNAESHPGNFTDNIGIGNIDATYNNDAAAATGDENGSFVGSGQWPVYPDQVSVFNTQASGLTIATYPNPASGIANIEFEIATAANVEVSLVDVSGKVIDVLANEYMAAGANNVTINATNYEQGLYFVQVNSANEKGFQKLIIE